MHPWLIFEVQDTGIGIAPDRREAIFDRFTQADPSTTRQFGGTGLGLSLCREWVDRMEGDIQLESQLGEGSLFRVCIPLPSAPVGVVPDRTGVARDRRVAIVLESPQQRAAHTRLLGQLGAEILEFSTLEGLAGLPSEELGRLDAAVVDRRFLDDPQTAARYPVGLAPQRVLALNRAGDPLDLPQALSGDGEREPVAGVLYRPVRRSSLASSLSGLWSEPVDQARAALPGKGEERLAGLKVLAVEDNPVNRRLLEAHLRHLGCEFTFACDGVEALERAEQADFGLVLMDCQMPRMDGYTASSKLREMPQGLDVVILALSANTLPEHARKCEAAGIDDWLGKPYTREDLREILLRWIDRAPARGVSSPKAQGA
ncbi:MAG: response regulator [Planctomycetota bacterium]